MSRGPASKAASAPAPASDSGPEPSSAARTSSTAVAARPSGRAGTTTLTMSGASGSREPSVVGHWQASQGGTVRPFVRGPVRIGRAFGPSPQGIDMLTRLAPLASQTGYTARRDRAGSRLDSRWVRSPAGLSICATGSAESSRTPQSRRPRPQRRDPFCTHAPDPLARRRREINDGAAERIENRLCAPAGGSVRTCWQVSRLVYVFRLFPIELTFLW